MRGEFIDVGGARLYYYAAGTRGAGEPVALIHGFPTSLHVWAAVAPLVPPGHRVIASDLLGFGRSDPPTASGAATDLTVRAHADRMVRLLDELRVERACLVGHGIGAAIALEAAGRYPRRVTRVALVNPVTAASWPSRLAAWARVLARLSPALPSPLVVALARRFVVRGVSGSARGVPVADQYLRPFAGNGGGEKLVRHLRALAARPAMPLPDHGFGGPATIVCGAADDIVPVALARRLQIALPHASLEVIAGGHLAPLESPELVAAALVKLLAIGY